MLPPPLVRFICASKPISKTTRCREQAGVTWHPVVQGRTRGTKKKVRLCSLAAAVSGVALINPI